MDAASRPTMMPWLQGDGYTSSQVMEEIRAVTDVLGDDVSYILYQADGNYDFAALQ